jgi:hypothetical protein
MAAELDEMVEGFRSRRLDGGPWCRLSGMDHNVAPAENPIHAG